MISSGTNCAQGGRRLGRGEQQMRRLRANDRRELGDRQVRLDRDPLGENGDRRLHRRRHLSGVRLRGDVLGRRCEVLRHRGFDRRETIGQLGPSGGLPGKGSNATGGSAGGSLGNSSTGGSDDSDDSTGWADSTGGMWHGHPGSRAIPPVHAAPPRRRGGGLGVEHQIHQVQHALAGGILHRIPTQLQVDLQQRRIDLRPREPGLRDPLQHLLGQRQRRLPSSRCRRGSNRVHARRPWRPPSRRSDAAGHCAHRQHARGPSGPALSMNPAPRRRYQRARSGRRRQSERGRAPAGAGRRVRREDRSPYRRRWRRRAHRPPPTRTGATTHGSAGLSHGPVRRKRSINSTASSRVVPGRRTTSGSGGGVREHLAAVDPNDDERMLPVRADQDRRGITVVADRDLGVWKRPQHGRGDVLGDYQAVDQLRSSKRQEVLMLRIQQNDGHVSQFLG